MKEGRTPEYPEKNPYDELQKSLDRHPLAKVLIATPLQKS